MKNVFVSNPYAKIEFATEQGNLEIIQEMSSIRTTDMDFDIISFNTDRDVGSDDCATFNLVLIYKDLRFKNIQGNDFVKFELGRGKSLEPIFFGMVDSIYESLSFVDLQPVRSITLTGRGRNKAFMQFDIGAIQEIEGSLAGLTGFFEGQIKIADVSTPAENIKTAVDYYTNKGIDMEFANGKHWKDYFSAIYKDDGATERYGNVNNAYTYQGSLWNYIKELRNAPFYEAFWEVLDKKPTFVVRPTPFNPDTRQELQLISTDEEDKDLIDANLGRSDLETYTVYSVKGESIVSDFNHIMGAPIWYKPFYKKYGLRRLEVVSKYIKYNGGGNSNQLLDGPISSGNGELAFPTEPGTPMTSPFGMRIHPIEKVQKMHEGVDLAKAMGAPIYAAESGKVKYVGYEAHGAGHYICLQHDNGLETRYFHLQEKPDLATNEKVMRGQQIGKMGSSGSSQGPHLHFEVRMNGKAIDPAPYIGIQTNDSSGAKGSPSPNPISDSIEFEVEEKKLTEYEEKLEDGKRQADEKLRYETELEVDYISRRNKKKAYLDEKTGKIKHEVESKEEKEAVIEALRNETEEKISEADRTDTTSTSQKTIDLFNWNIKNGFMENGSITFKGDTLYKVGTRLLIKSTNMEYYIEKVSHNFVYNEGWKTTLQVTRGLPYGDRFKAPWNQRTLISVEDVTEISGIDRSQTMIVAQSGTTDSSGIYNPMAYSDPTGFRSYIGQIAKSHAGEVYDQNTRMNEGVSDCSSFVYKVAMEAQGRNWRGTRAPATRDMPSSDLWYEIPLNQVQPWDILLRDGHTEFLGDDGRTYGAHTRGTPSGPGGQYNPSSWSRAFRIKGL